MIISWSIQFFGSEVISYYARDLLNLTFSNSTCAWKAIPLLVINSVFSNDRFPRKDEYGGMTCIGWKTGRASIPFINNLCSFKEYRHYLFNSCKIWSVSFLISSTALPFLCFSIAVLPSPIDEAYIWRLPIIVSTAGTFKLLI